MKSASGISVLAWLVAPLAFAAQPVSRVHTADGLALEFFADGRLAAIRLDAKPVALAKDPALFRVRDAAERSSFIPVTLSVEADGRGVALRSREDALGLALDARITVQGDVLQIDGELITRTARERCIDLQVHLPIDMAGFLAGSGLHEGPLPANRKKGVKQSDPDVDASEADGSAWYPLSPISNRSIGAGLTLAIPPTHPTRFVFGQDANGAHVLLRIGISAMAATPRRTAFRVIAYRHDAAWGFRSALARYYAFYREDFFARRVKRIGAWTTETASRLQHPQLYAYHEAGFSTWRHPDGTDSGINVKPTLQLLDEGSIARTLEDYERLCELAIDQRLGIYSLPYTIVGQRQLLQLPALPRNLDEALQVLENWSPRTPIPFDGPPQAGSFRSTEEQKEIIRNSTLHDREGRLAIFPRAYRGPTLTFPQNPNPNLFRDQGRPTVARYTLDYYVPTMLRSPYVDGIYVDSLGRWCGFYNYRSDHFRYSTVPLTYQGNPPRVCLWNLQSHAEYLWEARRQLHSQGKILMANGVGPERVMLGFACDVMGREGAPSYEMGEGFYAMRVAAGLKPFCLLNATHRVSARLWNSCLYLGYLMGCNAEPGLADEARYLPLIIRCNEAGWQPVTHARATPASIGVERWGGESSDGPLLFTLFNRDTNPASARVTLDASVLHRTLNGGAVELLGGLPIEAKPSGRNLILEVKLGPEEAALVELRN